jgi:hypothetical protein
MITVAAALLFQPQLAKIDGLSIGFARTEYAAPPISVGLSSKFKITFYNDSDKPVTLVTEGCSWGYEMISFEIMNPGHGGTPISRKPRPWRRNAPIPFQVGPHEAFLRSIDFGDGTWVGFPAGIAGSPDGWKVRAVLRLTADGILTTPKFWTGEIASPWTAALPG